MLTAVLTARERLSLNSKQQLQTPPPLQAHLSSSKGFPFAFLCEEISTLLRSHFAEVHKLDDIHVVRASKTAPVAMSEDVVEFVQVLVSSTACCLVADARHLAPQSLHAEAPRMCRALPGPGRARQGSAGPSQDNQVTYCLEYTKTTRNVQHKHSI